MPCSERRDAKRREMGVRVRDDIRMHRWIVGWISAALLFLAAACDSAQSIPHDSSPRGAVQAPAPGTHLPFHQRWRATNGQAKQIAGNLTIATVGPGAGAVTFAFANGVTIWATPALLPVDDASVRALVMSVQKSLGAPADVFPSFYSVRDERVALSAPQGGLCGGVRTRLLAVVQFQREPTDGTDTRTLLRVAAFHARTSAASGAPARLSLSGGAAPAASSPRPERLDPTALHPCFDFDYERDAADPHND